MKQFCTSGPVDKETCYYVQRPELMKEALDHIENWRYFTVSAPRQTGKTTFLNDIVDRIKDRYLPIFISFESYSNKNERDFLESLVEDMEISLLKIYGKSDIKIKIPNSVGNIKRMVREIYQETNKEIVLMIDEFEKLDNEKIISTFLHVIRSIYHDKKVYGLRSVVLISVGYLSGVLEDNASPFNIAEHLQVPYFTREQVYDLLGQHENESGQVFEKDVKELIWHNAGGQPGLTNALAYDLVNKKARNESVVTRVHFERSLNDFLRVYMDKNVANIINKAKKEEKLIKRILFEPEDIEFTIYDERINFLYLNGVIDNCDGRCCVRVPLYYKALYDRFKPQINGEKTYMATIEDTIRPYINPDGGLDLDKLLNRYVEYIKLRGAKMFEGRNYYEGVYQYNLDQFLSLYVQAADGRVYPETQVGGGRIDLLINLNNKEYLIEVKANITGNEYEKAKKQILEYINRKGLKDGWLVIYSNTIKDFEYITQEIDGVKLHIWFIKTKFESPSKVR